MTGSQAFEQLVAAHCPPPGELLLALAAELRRAPVAAEPRPAPAADAGFELDELGRSLFEVAAAGDPQATALALARLLTERERFLRDESSLEGLWLDRVLERRRGHPLVLAVVGVEAARRAGAAAELCSTPAGWFAGIGGPGRLYLVDPAADPGPAPSGAVRRHCGHEVGFAALTGILARLLMEGDEAGARRAARLRDRLPVARHGAA